MKFNNAVLESIAYDLPPEVWSSDSIESKLSPLYERLNLPTGRLELMTGIKERRFWPKNFRPSDASTLAGKKVLEKTKIPLDNIDLLIHSAVCRDRLEPATAAYVHKSLGLAPHTQIFDLSNACLGFLNAMSTAAAMIDAGTIRSALIVSGENGRPLLENTISSLLNSDLDRNAIKPYFANLTIGSGACAAIITHKDFAPDAPKIQANIVQTDTHSNHLCEGDSPSVDSLEMQTDSEKLLEVGIKLAKKSWDKFQELTGWSACTPDLFVSHQVGRRHLTQLYEALKIDMTKDFSTFPILGNVGSVSVPITLAMAHEQNKIKAGSKVALLGIGSGLSCIMMALQW